MYGLPVLSEVITIYCKLVTFHILGIVQFKSYCNISSNVHANIYLGIKVYLRNFHFFTFDRIFDKFQQFIVVVSMF